MTGRETVIARRSLSFGMIGEKQLANMKASCLGEIITGMIVFFKVGLGFRQKLTPTHRLQPVVV